MAEHEHRTDTANVDTSQLDQILQLQLGVAWAGEKETDPARLGWWRTGMCDEYGGEDLLRRLSPKTWQWAVLEVCRDAAKKVDAEARGRADDPDNLFSLFRFGFELDERLDERLLELKQSGALPCEAFPDLADLISEWSKERLESWLEGRGAADYTTTATGRRLRGEVPADPGARASRLASAFLPIGDTYVLPHFRGGK